MYGSRPVAAKNSTTTVAKAVCTKPATCGEPWAEWVEPIVLRIPGMTFSRPIAYR
ncbi:Uncharacterised protein [Mycobacteroides abscessus subsp. abscessus]|nr:Uncharacterised protein [Mycobacteroides abscessus subsp. abscessus]